MKKSTQKIKLKVVGESISGRFTREQLLFAFDKVKNKTNWKNPIDAIIPASEEEITAEAIAYFAGGNATFQPAHNGKLRVTADGYYLRIGA